MVPKSQQKEIIGMIKCAKTEDYAGMKKHLQTLVDLKTMKRLKDANASIEKEISK